MKKENSYGIIPLRFYKGNWQVLLIQHHKGYWAFPKGHAEREETPREAAERELLEETGLKVQSFFSINPIAEKYIFNFQGELISKTVEYFLALVKGKVVIQEQEVLSSKWLSLKDAKEMVTFKEGKHLCQQVIDLLSNVDINQSS